ncbi:MAG: hypothetical protein U9R79_14180 [Armatimonadota bacterium]|nr:hypothetical protein [Armatimonadota bacterium]
MRPILAALVAITAMTACSAVAQEAENPLAQVLPYGVYVGGNNPEWRADVGGREGLREAIDRVCEDLARHNMNCAWPNNLRWENLPLWLEAGERHGVRIIPQAGGPPGFVRAQWFKDKEDFAKRVEPFYEDLADKYGDSEALLAWSLTEENRPLEWFYEAIRDLTRKMAQWDPQHPVITMDNRAPTAWMNARTVQPKAFCRDVYVFFTDGLNGPVTPIGFESLLRRECQVFREAADHADAVFWMMGQGMALIGHGPGSERHVYRYPTPAEIRWQVWTALQEGAKGFFYFMYAGPQEPRERGEFIEGLRDRDLRETPQYAMAAKVGRQLQALAPILLEIEPAPPHQRVVYWENTPVSARTFVHQETGQRFVIAVNNDCAEVQRVGIELGYFPGMIDEGEKLFDLRSRQGYDYQAIKLTTLLPGDGTIYFVGTDEQWQELSAELYGEQ